MKRLAFLLAAFPAVAPAAASMGWQASILSEKDSENLLSAQEASLRIWGPQTRAGIFELDGKYRSQTTDSNAFGLRARSEPWGEVRLRHALLFGQNGLAVQGGMGTLSGWKDYSYGGELSRYFLLGSAVVTPKLRYQSRIEKESPLIAALAMRSQSAGLALTLSWEPWTAEFGTGAKYLDSVPASRAGEALQDSNFALDLARNRIVSTYFFFHRLAIGPLHLGGFASYADSRHDAYTMTSGSIMGSPIFLYFPYDTPLEAFSLGAMASLEADWEQTAVPLGAWSARMTLPFYSRRQQRGFGSRPQGPPWMGYYTLKNAETWSAEIKARKALAGKISAALAYRFSSRPYLEYGWFDRQSYRQHAMELTLSRF